MIYKIIGNQLAKAIQAEYSLVAMSASGEFALVRGSKPPSNYIEQYSESQLNTLLSDSLYRQPCRNC